MIIYKFLNVCPFDYTAFAVSGKVGIPLTGLTTSNWVAIVTPTDRHKSVRNRCVIEVLVAFLCCQVLLGFFVHVRAFVIGLSNFSSFSLHC